MGLTLLANDNGNATIQGPMGTIRITEVGCVDSSLLELLYWTAWSVLQGSYHCCLSLPGKVTLL